MDKKERLYVVYMYTNKTNGKKYIGQTYRKLEYRAGKNGIGYKNCTYFYNAIQKYGFENFEVKIIANNLTKTEANKFEKLMIKTLGTNKPERGYNLTTGGEGTTGVSHCIDMTGERFGKLVVMHRHFNSDNKTSYWLCKCDCGNECIKRREELKRGKYPTCGCQSYSPNYEHGMTGTRLYNLWNNTRSKCNTPTHNGYELYGEKALNGVLNGIHFWILKNGQIILDILIKNSCIVIIRMIIFVQIIAIGEIKYSQQLKEKNGL